MVEFWRGTRRVELKCATESLLVFIKKHFWVSTKCAIAFN